MAAVQIHHYHDAWLVVLSIAVATMASYTSLDLAGRLRESRGALWAAWLLAAAVAMGGGIWSMHFVAILAFHFALPVSYDIPLTVLSLLVPIVVTGIGLFVAYRRQGDRAGILVGGALMGIGVASMHYTGMAAMRMQATISYDPTLFVLSVLIAIGAASTALWLYFNPQPLTRKALSALVMGGAIAGMHYTGMAAVTLQSAPQLPKPEGLGLSRPGLAMGIAAATMAVLALALAAAFIDRRFFKTQREAIIVQRSAQRFRALVQNSSDVIAIIDRRGRVAYETSPVDRIPGHRPESLPDATFLDLVDAGDRDRAAALLEAAWSAPGSTERGELRLSPPEGPPRLFEVTLTNLSEEPTIDGIVANLHDITERRQAEALLRDSDARLRESERRYRQVVELIQVGIWIHTGGRIIFCNACCARIFGANSPDELIGRELLSLIHPADRPLSIQRSRTVAETRDPLPLAELRFLRLDGSTITLEVHAVSFLHEGKVHVLSSGRDVTAQREAEAQLVQAQKMEAVGQLTGGMAHDFNNLLTVVIGNLDIAMDAIPAELRAPLKNALLAAERGASLIQRLLAFSRKQTLVPEDLDFNRLAADMEDLLRRTLGEDIEIEIKLSPDLWPASADKGQVENALLNLAINARDAMPTGGKLTIETSNVHLDEEYAAHNEEVVPGDYVMLAVTDNGTGMPPDVLEHVFEPFFTTKEVGKGSGLGLSILYGFAKQSRGHMKIYSEVGHGTTVRLYLPRASGMDATVAPAEPEASEHLHQHGGETILVVEDDPDVRRLVVSQLSDLGYRLLEAASGPEARTILENGVPVDLLFTDVVMPGGMSGRELAEIAQRQQPDLKVLFTSGYTEDSIIHQGRLDPGVHLLSKPYKRKALAERLRRILDS